MRSRSNNVKCVWTYACILYGGVHNRYSTGVGAQLYRYLSIISSIVFMERQNNGRCCNKCCTMKQVHASVAIKCNARCMPHNHLRLFNYNSIKMPHTWSCLWSKQVVATNWQALQKIKASAVASYCYASQWAHTGME